MTAADQHPVLQQIETRYRQRTPRSLELSTKARERLPGGDTRSATFYRPYPTLMAKGSGCRLTDVDGNEYVDFLNNYTSLIHGHANPRVIEAAREQLEKGTVFGAATEIQARHAEHLCSRVPSLDQVRYGNSGTEGTMFAMRAARAFSGQQLFIKMDGGYHGSHDYAEVNVFPAGASKKDEDGLPARHVEPGAPSSVLNDVLVAPFNDLNAVETLLKRHAGQVAAVMLEPMLGALGMVVPQEGFLKELRALTERHGVLLIFDEVITFRLSTGGSQALDGVTPDLTALGKVIGGGFPVGAFGGRKDIMALFDPTKAGFVFHSGTFNGSDVMMAAGLATLELFHDDAVHKINALGQRLRDGIDAAFGRSGIVGQATGRGSLAQIHWSKSDIVNAAASVEASKQAGELLPRYLHLEMLNRGFYCAPRGMIVISTPMDEEVVDEFVTHFGETLDLLRGFVSDELPALLAT